MIDTYIEHLIAKATPTWDGVDPDGFMDDVRGRHYKMAPVPGTIPAKGILSFYEVEKCKMQNDPATPDTVPCNYSVTLEGAATESDNLSEHLARTSPDWAFVLADEGKREPETGEQLFFDL